MSVIAFMWSSKTKIFLSWKMHKHKHLLNLGKIKNKLKSCCLTFQLWHLYIYIYSSTTVHGNGTWKYAGTRHTHTPTSIDWGRKSPSMIGANGMLISAGSRMTSFCLVTISSALAFWRQASKLASGDNGHPRLWASLLDLHDIAKRRWETITKTVNKEGWDGWAKMNQQWGRLT